MLCSIGITPRSLTVSVKAEVKSLSKAKRIFKQTKNFKNEICKELHYTNNGFNNTDMKVIETYMPIILSIEKECGIHISEIVGISQVTSFDSWLRYLEQNSS
jgi:hypothetical protein